MERESIREPETDEERACELLLRTLRDQLSRDTMLRRLVGVSTSEELYFFGSVIAFGRYMGLPERRICTEKVSFNQFLDRCEPVRNEAMLILREHAIGLTKKERKQHFFRCSKKGGTYS